MVNFGPLAAEIFSLVWGTPSKFQRVSRLGSITAQPNFGVGTQGATRIRQGGHHVGHWPTFLVQSIISRHFRATKSFI